MTCHFPKALVLFSWSVCFPLPPWRAELQGEWRESNRIWADPQESSEMVSRREGLLDILQCSSRGGRPLHDVIQRSQNHHCHELKRDLRQVTCLQAFLSRCSKWGGWAVEVLKPRTELLFWADQGFFCSGLSKSPISMGGREPCAHAYLQENEKDRCKWDCQPVFSLMKLSVQRDQSLHSHLECLADPRLGTPQLLELRGPPTSVQEWPLWSSRQGHICDQVSMTHNSFCF